MEEKRPKRHWRPYRNESLERIRVTRRSIENTLHRNQDNVPLGEIQTIAGGFFRGDVSTSHRKVYARKESYEESFSVRRLAKQA